MNGPVIIRRTVQPKSEREQAALVEELNKCSDEHNSCYGCGLAKMCASMFDKLT